MPTFTLLGKQVLRLPFIKNTSLGHEILHSWFGNSIEPDYHTGNWSEGLTTYLADMAYRTEAGEGIAARKETIQKFRSYVDDTTPPLRQFVSAGHNTTAGRAERAVGYGRAAMLFHELENRIGRTIFRQAMQSFYHDFKGTSASWADLQSVFEKNSGLDLSLFFKDRLARNDLPDISLSELHTAHDHQSHQVSFRLTQNNAEPYDLLVPFTIQTMDGDIRFTHLITEKTTEISRSVNSQPLGITIDPEYNFMRVLTEKEASPCWSELMGTKDVLVILSDANDEKTYAPFIHFGSRFSWQITSGEKLSQKDQAEKNLIFLGPAPFYQGLYGKQNHNKSGFTMEVKYHPVQQHRIIAQVTSTNEEETAAAISRLSHYGKYAYLSFRQGKLTERRTSTADYGIHLPIETKPYGFKVSKMTGFDSLAAELEKHRIIYIGEQHTSRADHLLQLMVIEAMYKKDHNLAIGMEMFPHSSQQAINDYIFQDHIDEKTFLKQSDYYNVWRFDYRLFRPVFAFAKRNKIPIIALNLDSAIVSNVFNKGGIANLSAEAETVIPKNRKLDLPGYTERLRRVYTMHSTMTDTGGSVEDFIESQSLWDEYMAESISTFAINNPATRLIVLAGSQHTRKDSGIPPRVGRRLDIPQASVINLATNSLSGDELSRTTDFAFFLESAPLPPQGKIGVVLEEIEENDLSGLKIIEFSQSSQAAEGELLPNDVITRINNDRVKTMTDVLISMFDKSIGEKISLMVKRKNSKAVWEEHIHNVELTTPQKRAPHP